MENSGKEVGGQAGPWLRVLRGRAERLKRKHKDMLLPDGEHPKRTHLNLLPETVVAEVHWQ